MEGAMTQLPRAIPFDQDDTILSFGRRSLVLEELAAHAAVVRAADAGDP
jgi:hypothetical protein